MQGQRQGDLYARAIGNPERVQGFVMEPVIDLLVAPMRLFAFHPWAAFVVAGIFWIGFLNRDRYTVRARWVLAITAALWTLYAFWELWVSGWRSPTGDTAIRFDLVLLAPALVIALFLGLVQLLFGRQK
jgi:hypothetical protein